jgi:hypothetical protein
MYKQRKIYQDQQGRLFEEVNRKKISNSHRNFSQINNRANLPCFGMLFTVKHRMKWAVGQEVVFYRGLGKDTGKFFVSTNEEFSIRLCLLK